MKTAAVVAAGTTGTGLGTLLDLIPDSIGKLATLVGVFLSVVLIYTHLRNAKARARADDIAYERALLELAILREQEAERLEAAAKRNRRACDKPPAD